MSKLSLMSNLTVGINRCSMLIAGVIFLICSTFGGVFSGPDTGKYGPEKTPCWDTFHAVKEQHLQANRM